MKKFLLVLCCLSQVKLSWARDRLVIIQAITTTRKSFALALGRKEGILPGQESLFTNRNASMVARAVEVTRDYSRWIPVTEKMIVPFSKREYVTMTNSKENIWLELPELHVKDIFVGFTPRGRFSLKGGLSSTMSESITQIQETESSRSGTQLAALYTYHFRPQWEAGGGLRYDNETGRIENPALETSTQRIMLIGEIYYHFPTFDHDTKNFYTGLGLGYGKNTTIVSDSEQSGSVLLFPRLLIGFEWDVGKRTSLLIESYAEGLSIVEDFSETIQQKTNLINIGLNLGLRF